MPVLIVTGPTLEALYPVGSVYVVPIVILFTTSPFDAINSGACSAPVLGVYRYLAFDV